MMFVAVCKDGSTIKNVYYSPGGGIVTEGSLSDEQKEEG